MGSSHHEGPQGTWDSRLEGWAPEDWDPATPTPKAPWRIQGTYRAAVAELEVGRTCPLTFLVSPRAPFWKRRKEKVKDGGGSHRGYEQGCQCTKTLTDFCTRLAMKIKKEKSPDFVRWTHGKLR